MVAVATTSTAAAPSDAIETYLVRASVTAKPRHARVTAAGDSTANTPAAAATPLPPRNPSHTGKRWPTTAHTPAAGTIVAGLVARRSTSSTAAAPFVMSS